LKRWLAGIAAFLLLVTGSVIFLRGNAEEISFPPAPESRALMGAGSNAMSETPDAPEADQRAKEAKRFNRSDKNEDGKITLAEMVEPRRKAFGKLDLNTDGKLSFEEWSSKAIGKFEAADRNRDQALDRSEFATTAPKVRKKPACSC